MRFGVVVLALLAALPTRGAAQFPPDSFTNLRVLPRDISQRELLGVMRDFTFALGVSCQHCHVGSEQTPLDSIDFASDEKRTKRTARLMLRMVAAINAQYLAAVPERPVPPVEVRCMSCHRGVARPALIQDVLAGSLDAGGADSAVARYRALREEHFGSAAYDFSAEALNEFAAELIRQRRAGHALPLLRLSVELNPRSLMAQFYLGEAYRVQGDTMRALTAYREALQIEPGQAFIRSLIERLGGGPP